MSADWRPLVPIAISDLLDGRLEEFNVYEVQQPATPDSRVRQLTDGSNFLWVFVSEQGFVSCLTRYGSNDPNQILGAIDDAFNAQLVSEHEPQFWGFDSYEEWTAWEESESQKRHDEFYAASR